MITSRKSLLRMTLAAALLVPALCAQAQDAFYPVKVNIGIVEGWRVTPDAIGRWCESVDPDGIERRKAAAQKWQTENAALIAHINSDFDAIVPAIMPIPPERALNLVHAHILVEVSKTNFLGKQGDEAKAVCTSFDAVSNQKSNVGIVQKALAELDEWKAAYDKSK